MSDIISLELYELFSQIRQESLSYSDSLSVNISINIATAKCLFVCLFFSTCGCAISCHFIAGVRLWPPVHQALGRGSILTQKTKKEPPSPSVLMDTSAACCQKWLNIDSAWNPRQLSHPLHVVPVYQANSLRCNSLCLTSPRDRMRLIRSAGRGLPPLRGINIGSITSNQALITFSMLIAVVGDVISFFVCSDLNDHSTETDLYFTKSSIASSETNHVQTNVISLMLRSLNLLASSQRAACFVSFMSQHNTPLPAARPYTILTAADSLQLRSTVI